MISPEKRIQEEVVPHLLHEEDVAYILFKESSDDVSKGFLRTADFPAPLDIGILGKQYVNCHFESTIERTELDPEIQEYLLTIADLLDPARDCIKKDFGLFGPDVENHPVLKKIAKSPNNEWETAVIILFAQIDPIFISKKMSSEELIKLADPSINQHILVLLFNKNLNLVKRRFNKSECPEIVNCIKIGPRNHRKKFNDILRAMPQQDLAKSIRTKNNESRAEKRKQHST